MTNTDLSILADAIAFALVVAIGGVVLYAVARAALRRTSRQVLIAGLPIAALVALALAGTAVWPFARESMNEAVGVRLDDQGHPVGSAGELGLDELPDPGFAGSSGIGQPARLFKVASIGIEGSVDPPAPADGSPADEAANGGSSGDSGDWTGDAGDGDSGGGGTDPSPTVEPSPTGDPSPTGEPSPSGEPAPSGDPSPTSEPSPTDDPPGPPWGSPGPPPRSQTRHNHSR